MAEFKTNGRGVVQLVDSAGFAYSKHYGNVNTNSMFWRCEKRQSSIWKCNKTNKLEDWKCLARVTTEGNYIIKYIRDHKHPPFGETFLK